MGRFVRSMSRENTYNGGYAGVKERFCVSEIWGRVVGGG